MNISKKEDKLQKAIDLLLDKMTKTEPHSPEYSGMADQLEKLYRAQESKDKAPVKLKETGMVVAGNLLGVLAIVNYERIGIMSKTALSTLIKPKN